MREDIDIALPPGRWVKRGLVHVFIEDPFVLPDDFDEAVKVLHGMGQNDRQIGDELDCSSAKVWRTRVEFNLPAIQRTGEPIKSGGKPLDWSVVERLVNGDRGVKSRPRERVEAVRKLNARGLLDGEIGEFIGVDGLTVFRIRKRNGISANKQWKDVA